MRPWLVHLGCFGVPLLLGTSAALVLRSDADTRRIANDSLDREIRAIAPGIADLTDLNRVHARLLQRKQIIEAIEVDPMSAADGLGFLSRLPSGVELVSLVRGSSGMKLAIHATDRDVATVVELLAPSGYRDARVASRAPAADGAVVTTIEATATRGGAR